jgi:carbon storage regulator CsrA
MLVLRRRAGQEIIIRIGNEIIATVQVTDVSRGKAGIGITAPPHVTVHRKEVNDLICWQVPETVDTLYGQFVVGGES